MDDRDAATPATVPGPGAPGAGVGDPAGMPGATAPGAVPAPGAPGTVAPGAPATGAPGTLPRDTLHGPGTGTTPPPAGAGRP